MNKALSERVTPHLAELRQRVVVWFAAIIVFAIAAYFFVERIAFFFMQPLLTAHPLLANLVYTNLTEAFISYLKVALLVGIIAGFPVLCYQGWRFITPGLKKHEKKNAFQITFWATVLFAGGVLFAFFVIMPQLLAFFIGFAGENLTPLPKLDAYLAFIMRGSLTFGLAFQIPFLMIMAVKTAMVARGYFIKHRQYFYLAIMFLSLLLTVGDIFSAILLSVPLFGLYELGLLGARLFSGTQSTEVR